MLASPLRAQSILKAKHLQLFNLETRESGAFPRHLWRCDWLVRFHLILHSLHWRLGSVRWKSPDIRWHGCIWWRTNEEIRNAEMAGKYNFRTIPQFCCSMAACMAVCILRPSTVSTNAILFFSFFLQMLFLAPCRKALVLARRQIASTLYFFFFNSLIDSHRSWIKVRCLNMNKVHG